MLAFPAMNCRLRCRPYTLQQLLDSFIIGIITHLKKLHLIGLLSRNSKHQAVEIINKGRVHE
jgi:hypothetical protein